METLGVGKTMVLKVLLESLELQDTVRLMEFLKGSQESQEQQSLDLKEQLPEQADPLKELLPEQVGTEATQGLRLLEQAGMDATQGLRVHLRRPGRRPASRRRGQRRRVVLLRMVGTGPPERARGLRRRLKRRVGGVRRRRHPLLGRAPRGACRT